MFPCDILNESDSVPSFLCSGFEQGVVDGLFEGRLIERFVDEAIALLAEIRFEGLIGIVAGTKDDRR